jgi:hypothetical protein
MQPVCGILDGCPLFSSTASFLQGGLWRIDHSSGCDGVNGEGIDSASNWTCRMHSKARLASATVINSRCKRLKLRYYSVPFLVYFITMLEY